MHRVTQRRRYISTQCVAVQEQVGEAQHVAKGGRNGAVDVIRINIEVLQLSKVTPAVGDGTAESIAILR